MTPAGPRWRTATSSDLEGVRSLASTIQGKRRIPTFGGKRRRAHGGRSEPYLDDLCGFLKELHIPAPAAQRRLVLTDDESGHIVGVLSYRTDGDAVMLEAVAIAPSRRREGLGRSAIEFMLDELTAYAIERSYPELVLMTNVHCDNKASLAMCTDMGWLANEEASGSGYIRYEVVLLVAGA